MTFGAFATLLVAFAFIGAAGSGIESGTSGRATGPMRRFRSTTIGRATVETRGHE